MTAQGVLLDQGNIFFRHLAEESKGPLTHDSSDDGDDESEESDDDRRDDNRLSKPVSNHGTNRQNSGVEDLDPQYSDGHISNGLGHENQGISSDQATHGATADNLCFTSRQHSKDSARSACVACVAEDSNNGGESIVASQFEHHQRRISGPDQRLLVMESVSDIKDDDAKEDSDGVDEDEEDRLPGLARAHLNLNDEDRGDNDDDNGEGDPDTVKKLDTPEESPSRTESTENRCESDLGGQLANPDVAVTSETMNSVRDINVCNLGQLHKLNKNDPTVKRLLVRPRLTTREVKTIRLDPDIKAVVDDFLRTNITGDFTIARVLRENYATFHPWLASQIQTERNAWAVRLRQAMEAGEKSRREGLDSATVVLEAGLLLRDLVQTCSNCMYAHPKGTGVAQTKPGRVGNSNTTSNGHLLQSTESGPGPASFNKRCNNDQTSLKPQQQILQQKPSSRTGLDRPKVPGVLSHSDARAGSIFRLNGLAKASLASDVDVSALNQKLVRLTTIVGKDNTTFGETDTMGQNYKDKDLTPSPMNMLRVEDADIYNYESDPGVYPSPRLSCGKKRISRGLHEGYLHRKRSNLSYGTVTDPDRSSKNYYGKGPSLYHRTLRDNHNTNNSNKSRSCQWYLNDLETLMEREFGPDSSGNTGDNGTDWSTVIRDNLDVLTELCHTLVTEKLDCLDVLGCRSSGENASLVFALQEHLRQRQESEDRHREEMEYRMQMLEDENQALQAQVSMLKRKLASTNESTLSLRQQISKLESLVGGVQPEMVNKCVGTGDSFLPKPRVPGGNNGVNNNKNGFNPFSTLHTATLVYAGNGSTSRYAVKATLAKGRRRRSKPLNGFRRPSHHYSDVSDSETVDDDIVIHRNSIPRLSLVGNEADLERADDSVSIISAPAVPYSVPQIRLGLATQEKPLVEISEEKLQTLKQRANTLEQSLQDALNNMDSSNKATPHGDLDSKSSRSGTPASSRSRDKRQPASGRNSARHPGDRPRFWTEASFEVNGSPPASNKESHGKPSSKDSKNTKDGLDTEKTPRRAPLTVIKRPPDYCHASSHFQQRRAASETLPFTLEHEKSSLLSGRALPLASTTPLDKSLTLETPRRKVSPASVASTNSSKDKDKSSSSNSISNNKPKQNSDNHSKTDSQTSVLNGKTKDRSYRSSFFNNGNISHTKTINNNQSNKQGPKETNGSSLNDNKKPAPRLKATRGGGLVAKCLRCQKLFNSVDNHKLACCYHPKEKARFEHYDGSGRLVAVVHAWQCCQQPQDADGCCFGQHV